MVQTSYIFSLMAVGTPPITGLNLTRFTPLCFVPLRAQVKPAE